MLSTFMPSKRRVDHVVKERNVLLATAVQSPTEVAGKNLSASRRSTRRQEAQGKDVDTNVQSC